jgi:hypothetical protein
MHGLSLTLFLGLGLLSVEATFYGLPPFDTVHVGNMGQNQATIVILPSADQTFGLNATQSGITYSVSDGTLQLNQVATLDKFLDDLFHESDEQEVQTGAIYVEIGGPLQGVLSDTTNDVVVGDRFSAPSFAATLTCTGRLVVLGITTPQTTIWNTGYAMLSCIFKVGKPMLGFTRQSSCICHWPSTCIKKAAHS